jgi:hypothetical protein
MREVRREERETAQGTTITARPWTQGRYRYDYQPPAIVGVLLDHSASMDYEATVAAELGYVLSRACRASDIESAGVAFDNDATVIWNENRPLPKVPRFPTQGGTDGMVEALDHLSKLLPLEDTRRTRVVVVLSDAGLFNDYDDNRDCWEELEHYRQQGVVFIWASRSFETGVKDHFPVGRTYSGPYKPHAVIGGYHEVTATKIAEVVTQEVAAAN